MAAKPIRPLDMRLIEDLFEMGSGYVLDFSNQTFTEFFIDELGVNIDDPRYAVEGGSKGKRLRYFLRTCSAEMRIRTVTALWEVRKAYHRRRRIVETIPDAEGEFRRLLERLGGKDAPRAAEPRQQPQANVPLRSEFDPARAGELKQRLLQVTSLDAQARGYAFERFLKDMFDANGLAPHASFRIKGEQIDGSFLLNGETYLLEAKWTAAQVDAADLRSFNAKVEDKAAWSRGLFVSSSGFSPDGLVAFGRAKRLVCMDGLDLYDMLERPLSFTAVMVAKLRWAAERGEPFRRVRDLL